MAALPLEFIDQTSLIGPKERIMERGDGVYFPGHGGRIEEPQRLVKAYMLHRRMREQAIMECVRKGQTTIPEIVAVIYRGIDQRLIKDAGRKVFVILDNLSTLATEAGKEPPPDDLTTAEAS